MRKPLPFNLTSDHLLLGIVLTVLWGISDSTTVTPEEMQTASSTEATMTPTLSTTPLTTHSTTKAPPENVQNVTVSDQTVSSITLMWNKVDNIPTYILINNNSSKTETINATHQGTSVTHKVSSLTAATKYNFTLITVFEDARSPGYSFEAVTAPENVQNVTVSDQTVSSITLMWNKVDNIPTYILINNNSSNTETINATHQGTSVTHKVSSLTAATKYNFTLITVFEDVRSLGYSFEAVTAPENVQNVTVSDQTVSSITLMWNKVDNIPTYILINNNSSNTETINATHQGTSVTHKVSSLTAATKYNFTLITVFEDVRSLGYSFEAVTAPENVQNVTVSDQTVSSITLMWNKVDNIPTYILINNNSSKTETIDATHQGTSVTHKVSSLTAATKYNFTLITVFEDVRSPGYSFEAVTAPESVQNVTVSDQTVSSITLMWNKVDNIPTYILINNNSSKTETIDATHQGTSVTHKVSSLTAATKYNFTLITVFEDVRSLGYSFEAVTAPESVQNVTVSDQTVSSITLMWNKVDNIPTYILINNNSSNMETINATHQGTSVTHKVSSLTAGTKHKFTLITVFEDVRSLGYSFEAVTAPENVQNVTVSDQTVSSITLMWNKVDNIPTYILINNNSSKTETINATHQGTSVTHKVSSLTAATKYNFTLITVFEDVRSLGYSFEAVTAPENVQNVTVSDQTVSSITLMWNKVDNIPTYILINNNSSKTETINATHQGTSVTHKVSSLTAATKYNFTLITVFEDVRSLGYSFEAVTAPENVQNVTVSDQTVSSITLMWNKVGNIPTYILINNNSSKTETINATHQGTSVTHKVSSLTAGTKHNFTLITVFEEVRSLGYSFETVTVPSKVALVKVTERSVTTLTLQWDVDVDKDWSYSLQINGENLQVQLDKSMAVVSLSSLQPGTEYPFRVITTFSGLNSAAYENFTVTTIDCSEDSVTWHVTSSSIRGIIEGLFTNATATNKSQTHVSPGGSNVSFTGLYPGATYEVSLEYEKNGRTFQQCQHNLTIIPPDLDGHCENWAGGYSVFILWNKPEGIWTAVEVNVTGESHIVNEVGEQHIKIPGFLPARSYEVSLVSLNNQRRSAPYIFSCSTDSTGVIAGSVFAVLLFGVLVCLAVFVFLKRPDIISRKKSFIGGSKLSNKKCKAICVANFPDHVSQLSGDDHRGFSQEYESLIPVGTEQTRKEAILPENKAKNRFNNVLPYDWCRVRLTTSNHSVTSDYINASYMPGYNSNREYIATQGPLPTTVNDFWRMIWEQRVKDIVMVTNCMEGGRIKCEQYWPAFSEPRLYGALLVTTRSEQQQANWTLREFMVKHNNTSEERTVKHFHFTAWPDHGVPQGTEVLIQFRELVRQQIQRNRATAPTVVHCSAGVGRTGTIIALDVLLQQLEKEKEVGINGFVHKMRLSRPHMVQTESQYVFLHQCIMDRLQSNEKTEENIYENTDVIYANATALQELCTNA